MRAVVTGGAGFIGSHVAAALVARGDEVHVLDNLATGLREYVPTGAELHVADIRSDADVASVFDEARPDLCFHLAAQADVGTSVAEPLYDAEVNVLGTLRLIEVARRHGTQLVFSSTGGAIYGECTGPAAESAPRRPVSPYGTAKLAAEEYLATWNRLHGSTHVALRFGNVFGPRQAASLEGGVVAIFLDRMAEGETSTIFGDGSQTRDFVYVGDIVRAALAAEGHEGGVFNIGTGAETSVSTLYDACARVAGFDGPAEYAPARAGDLLRSVLDPSLAATELDWRAETSLEEGLAETWSWIRSK